jgi:hypothetical protein
MKGNIIVNLYRTKNGFKGKVYEVTRVREPGILKCVMLTTPEDQMAETMSFASLTDAVAVFAVATEQRIV